MHDSATPKKARIGLLASEVPPPKARGRMADLLKLIPDLKGQPDTWFRVAEFASRQAATSYGNKLRERAPEVEWTARSFDGGSILWGCWRGEKTGDA